MNQIDIEAIIGGKNPKLLKRLPKFVIRYIKKIVHQDDVNQILRENKDLKGVDFCHDLIKRFNITLQVTGKEHIPKSEGVILASNHPLAGMDSMALVQVISDIRTDIKFIVNDLLMNLDNLKDLFVGVNKVGKKSGESLLEVGKLFEGDNLVIIFPAGLVSRKIDGKVMDPDWNKTFVSQARRNQKQIIPVHVDGKLSNFFYNFAQLRKFLGIKGNIEMFFLVNELFKQKNKTINVTFGKPISVDVEFPGIHDRIIAREIQNRVYNL
jgi:putative hemolysin